MGSPTLDTPLRDTPDPIPGSREWLSITMLGSMALDNQYFVYEGGVPGYVCGIDEVGARPLMTYDVAALMNDSTCSEFGFLAARWIVMNHRPTRIQLEEYFSDVTDLFQRFPVTLPDRVGRLSRDHDMYAEANPLEGDRLVDVVEWLLAAIRTEATSAIQVADAMNFVLTQRGQAVRYAGILAHRTNRLLEYLEAQPAVTVT